MCPSCETTEPGPKAIEELVYGGEHRVELQAEIRGKWPEAIFEDASDEIHVGRFNVRLPDGVTEDEFYLFVIRAGFAELCFRFQLMLHGGDEEHFAKIRRWLDILKAEDAAKE